MGELLITYRYTDPADHMNEKTESVKLMDVPDKETAYLRAGILMGLWMKWQDEHKENA